MLLKSCEGLELEKAQPNTSEDFFNRSSITFIENGKEKTLHVLYIRYFDEIFTDHTPYESDPVFSVNDRDVTFKDVVALVCLIKKPDFRNRKRIYINTEQELFSFFEGIQLSELPNIFKEMQQGGYELRSPMTLLTQP
ncbi:hypothetical protein [Bacillus solimangrovi]|uniref:Uncharacterized protein n=1 Tax=Bacillus solimangrovi TaxID=1305675 RepID=A0A1E5LHI9_9BACI|nr:hypothetical protein [Bacillus solimangrovi]OEH93535.1 hypothetical protein BFG57_00660 [Bacillus solimangrovi]